MRHKNMAQVKAFLHYNIGNKRNWRFETDTFLKGWDACKEEVLKIIKNHPNIDENTSLEKAFEKIREL